MFNLSSDASIKASAQIDTDSSKKCSGGSGGLIRLKARKVGHTNFNGNKKSIIILTLRGKNTSELRYVDYSMQSAC